MFMGDVVDAMNCDAFGVHSPSLPGCAWDEGGGGQMAAMLASAASGVMGQRWLLLLRVLTIKAGGEPSLGGFWAGCISREG